MENNQAPQVGTQTSTATAPGLAPLMLASASPRRAEILRIVGWPFVVRVADVDESRIVGEGAVDYVQRLAREKAVTVAAASSGLVLGADTVVVIDGLVLGKPVDDEDARRMLKLLSGKWHEVLTGVALVDAADGREAVACERTRVRFAALSDEEMTWYVAGGEPLDKAGAYAVQGQAALFIEAVEGDYWNVVGLPIQLVYKLALRFDRGTDVRC